MGNQQSLFDMNPGYQPPVRKSDPETSQQAARELAPTRKAKAASMLRVFREMYTLHEQDSTANEAAARCVHIEGGVAESYRKRYLDLLTDRSIEPTRKRRCGITGKLAQAFRATR